MCHGNRKSQKPPPPKKNPIYFPLFQQQSPESAVLMALICAHHFFFFLSVFSFRICIVGFFLCFGASCAEGSVARVKSAVITKRKRAKMEGVLAEQRLHCVNSLGVTGKYDFPFLNNSTYQQSALRSTV